MEMEQHRPYAETIPKKEYERELLELQVELLKLQSWCMDAGRADRHPLRGPRRGRQGRLDPPVHREPQPPQCAHVALPKPNDTERTQWYFQRYVAHLPAAGEIVLFDRSWYNRAGVEYVMGFCTREEYAEFFRQVPMFEAASFESGIHLFKLWFTVSAETSSASASTTARPILCGNGSSHRWT